MPKKETKQETKSKDIQVRITVNFLKTPERRFYRDDNPYLPEVFAKQLIKDGVAEEV